MVLFLEDSVVAEIAESPAKEERLKRSLTDHLTALLCHVFLSCRPARPSQSRWTGVANVCQFALGLALCHRLLKPLLCALSAKKDDGDGDGNGDVANMDADARDSNLNGPPQHIDFLSDQGCCCIFFDAKVAKAKYFDFAQVQVADTDAYRLQQSTRRQLLSKWQGPKEH